MVAAPVHAYGDVVSIILIKDVGRDWGLLRRSLIDVLRTFLVICHSGSLKVDKPERPLLQVTYTFSPQRTDNFLQ